LKSVKDPSDLTMLQVVQRFGTRLRASDTTMCGRSSAAHVELTLCYMSRVLIVP
jgi:hypothetical protein